MNCLPYQNALARIFAIINCIAYNLQGIFQKENTDYLVYTVQNAISFIWAVRILRITSISVTTIHKRDILLQLNKITP
ncbi:hypothetical protein DSUL_90039 [Desulfovibrionales bacterium]